MNGNNTNSLTDGLLICDSTGTGRATNQLYGEGGEARNSYDHSFQCQQIEDRTFLYAICSGHKLAAFAKEKLICEILFGQLNGSTKESVKDVLRLAFAALEKDLLNLIDGAIIQEIQQQLRDLNGLSDDEVTQHFELANRENQQISIALALIHKSKLYICNVGQSRVILCKTDDQNVLRAVQLSSGYENGNKTVQLCEKTASITSRLEIIGPIPIDDSCQFLVLMSCGLCKTLKELHTNDVQQFIRSIVQQLRSQSTLTAVAQSVIDQIVAEHYNRYLNLLDESTRPNGRPDLTLLVRKFNFHMPNLIPHIRHRPTVSFNSLNKEHLITNTSFSSSNPNTLYMTNSTTDSCPEQTELCSRTLRPYVDFSGYYRNVENARINGTLSTKIKFD